MADLLVRRRRAGGHDGRRPARAAPAAGSPITDGLVERASAAPADRAARRRRGAATPTAAWSRPAWSTPTTTSTRTSPGPTARRTGVNLFGWLTTLYPLWAGSTRRRPTSRPGSAWPSWPSAGCTTTTDHLYVHPTGGGDLITAEITAAARARRALPRHPRLDEPVAEGRRPAARLGRAGRRRRSWPTPSGWSALHHDPAAGRDGPGRAGARARRSR